MPTRSRRGPNDGTLTQAGIALIALGSLTVAFSVATTSRAQGPNETGLTIGAVLASAGLLLIGVAAVAATVRYFEDRSPPLEIEFLEDGMCIQDILGRGRQLRVKVTNRGRIALRQVRVHMTVLDPPGRPDHFLHIRNDNSSNFQRSWDGENLVVGGWTYFDVAFIGPPPAPANYGDTMVVEYADAFLKWAVWCPTAMRVSLRAEGWLGDVRDVPGTTRDFWVIAPSDRAAATLED